VGSDVGGDPHWETVLRIDDEHDGTVELVFNLEPISQRAAAEPRDGTRRVQTADWGIHSSDSQRICEDMGGVWRSRRGSPTPGSRPVGLVDRGPATQRSCAAGVRSRSSPTQLDRQPGQQMG
jgi:hypothetical protein